jgi:hypothetical protein
MHTLARVSIAALLTAAPAAASAQESIHHASVAGRVADPQEAAIAGAEVSARHLQTNVRTAAQTDVEGRFRLPFLRIGAYELTVAKAGFKTAQRALSLNAGSAFQLPIALEIGGLEESVTVTDTVVLEMARSQIAGTVSSAEVQSLPLNGRNFLDLALLVPGVSPTNTASTQLFAETSAVP